MRVRACSQRRTENRARIRATTNGVAEGEWVAAKVSVRSPA
jgi:hypothetical protein